jgi:hypothetical protein
MKALPYLMAAAVVAGFVYLWNQIKLWRCATGSALVVDPGSVVSESTVCAAKLGLYGLSYDAKTGSVGKGTLPSGDSGELAEYTAATRTFEKAATGDDGQSGLDAITEWASDTFKPWEEFGMTKDAWCNSDLPSYAQRFAFCDIATFW